ncbi:MAG: hypothetical protein ACJ8BW_14225 [Ktedonobacteraceae bacterium]
MSIEPAVARQITIGAGDGPTAPSQASNSKSVVKEKHVVAEKKPTKRPSQDNRRHGADGAPLSQEGVGRTRNNSLRHAKNSKELLRERSIKRNGVRGIDAHSASKEGRNFTVGRVGTGGLIYLR